MKVWLIWNLKRFLLHIPVGVLAYTMSLVSPGLGIICTAAFIYYELNEDKHISDHAYKDSQGFLGGLLIAHVIHLGIIYL